MTDTTYQGWKNWATWNAALWMDNEEPIYRAQKYCRTAQELKETFFEYFPTGTPDMDPIDLCDIDWDEIFSHKETE